MLGIEPCHADRAGTGSTFDFGYLTLGSGFYQVVLKVGSSLLGFWNYFSFTVLYLCICLNSIEQCRACLLWAFLRAKAFEPDLRADNHNMGKSTHTLIHLTYLYFLEPQVVICACNSIQWTGFSLLGQWLWSCRGCRWTARPVPWRCFGQAAFGPSHKSPPNEKKWQNLNLDSKRYSK